MQKRQPFILLRVTKPEEGPGEEQAALPAVREGTGFLLARPGTAGAQALDTVGAWSAAAKGGHVW